MKTLTTANLPVNKTKKPLIIYRLEVINMLLPALIFIAVILSVLYTAQHPPDG